MFELDELEEIGVLLSAHPAGSSDPHEFWLISMEDDKLIGIAYCVPKRMTEGTWNLLLIAVHPDWQGQGHGEALIKYVEQRLAASGERILPVETSAILERTRASYRNCGYDEEACIRDYYQARDDKIIYRKALTAQN